MNDRWTLRIITSAISVTAMVIAIIALFKNSKNSEHRIAENLTDSFKKFNADLNSPL